MSRDSKNVNNNTHPPSRPLTIADLDGFLIIKNSNLLPKLVEEFVLLVSNSFALLNKIPNEVCTMLNEDSIIADQETKSLNRNKSKHNDIHSKGHYR